MGKISQTVKETATLLEKVKQDKGKAHVNLGKSRQEEKKLELQQWQIKVSHSGDEGTKMT